MLSMFVMVIPTAKMRDLSRRSSSCRRHERRRMLQCAPAIVVEGMSLSLLANRTVLVAALLLSVAHPRAQTGWTSLWNGTSLEGWTTWMRQPERSSEVPGLKRDADGKYAEPIGSGRDPLHVFTVVPDVDGRPAIRISGEVFGEL